MDTTQTAKTFAVEQFFDKGLAHNAYAVASEGQVAVIDPARDPQPYFDFAEAQGAKIVAVIETHPHADFVSSHAEIARRTGATVYVSAQYGPDYPHRSLADGESVQIGSVSLQALFTPGHSPDSISMLLKDPEGTPKALFSGDTLFIGDVGRPDLRESAGAQTAKREELARMMYRTTRKLRELPPEVSVYPAHGAGSLCGKNISSDLSSTIGRELEQNYALQEGMGEEEFVKTLLEDQPFVPKYFGFSVDLNRVGAADYEASVKAVPRASSDFKPEAEALVIDTRPHEHFKKAHFPGAINLMDGGKFETWLGSVVGPEEEFYLLAENEATLESVIRKAAKIGYETKIKAAMVAPEFMPMAAKPFDLERFKANPEAFTVVDVRNYGEVKGGRPFGHSLNVPLPELRERASEIDASKPVVVHCAAGYRSAAGHSIVSAQFPDKEIYDLSEAVNDFPMN